MPPLPQSWHNKLGSTAGREGAANSRWPHKMQWSHVILLCSPATRDTSTTNNHKIISFQKRRQNLNLKQHKALLSSCWGWFSLGFSLLCGLVHFHPECHTTYVSVHWFYIQCHYPPCFLIFLLWVVWIKEQLGHLNQFMSMVFVQNFLCLLTMGIKPAQVFIGNRQSSAGAVSMATSSYSVNISVLTTAVGTCLCTIRPTYEYRLCDFQN